MVNRVINYLFLKVTGKLLVVFIFLYMLAAIGMQWGAKHIAKLSGKDEVQILDLCISGYSLNTVNSILSDYSPAARSFAATFNVIADSIYPLTYTAMLVLIMAWVYKNRVGSTSPIRQIILLPSLVMIVDLAENFHIIAMLKLYPDIPVSIIIIGSFFTQLKWGLLIVIIILILAGFLLKKRK